MSQIKQSIVRKLCELFPIVATNNKPNFQANLLGLYSAVSSSRYQMFMPIVKNSASVT